MYVYNLLFKSFLQWYFIIILMLLQTKVYKKWTNSKFSAISTVYFEAGSEWFAWSGCYNLTSQYCTGVVVCETKLIVYYEREVLIYRCNMKTAAGGQIGKHVRATKYFPLEVHTLFFLTVSYLIIISVG